MPDDDIDLTVVVGKAIRFKKIENPTKDDIDKHQKLYLQSVQTLFNKFKGKYSPDKDAAVLEIHWARSLNSHFEILDLDNEYYVLVAIF